jgi:hypothetical protein
MVGIIVDGDNHFIVRGPRPTPDQVRELVLHWSLIRIGAAAPPHLREWSISAKEFREDLVWAYRMETPVAAQPAVEQLLCELEARGVHATPVPRSLSAPPPTAD